MSSFLDDLLQATPQGRREQVRADLRVLVTESLLSYMQAANVTKADLALRMGVTRSAVTQALVGSRNLSLNTLADIAHALQLNVHMALEPRRALLKAAAQSSVTTVLAHGALAAGSALPGYTAVNVPYISMSSTFATTAPATSRANSVAAGLPA